MINPGKPTPGRAFLLARFVQIVKPRAISEYLYTRPNHMPVIFRFEASQDAAANYTKRWLTAFVLFAATFHILCASWHSRNLEIPAWDV